MTGDARKRDELERSRTLQFNQEVPSSVRQQLREDLEGVVQIDRTRTIYMMSGTVPETVQLLLDSLEWIDALKAGAVVFLSAYAKKLGELAAESTWNHGKAIANALNQEATDHLWEMAQALAQTRQSLSLRARIVVGLPFPEEYHGTLLQIDTDDEREIALILALFVSRIEEIERRLRSETEETGILGASSLDLTEEGNFVVSWVGDGGGEHEIEISTPLSERGNMDS